MFGEKNKFSPRRLFLSEKNGIIRTGRLAFASLRASRSCAIVEQCKKPLQTSFFACGIIALLSPRSPRFGICRDTGASVRECFTENPAPDDASRFLRTASPPSPRFGVCHNAGASMRECITKNPAPDNASRVLCTASSPSPRSGICRNAGDRRTDHRGSELLLPDTTLRSTLSAAHPRTKTATGLQRPLKPPFSRSEIHEHLPDGDHRHPP